ncbi:carboxypeptidase-like regulatory domain-containing protein [Flavobacterium azooxidireducens]|uniref:Carboxypeptidase-like regulatory domain-containing protein n=1 Tax=Flavobacterium azooxidireducens TaxID=1871076 RepID=A0ABY4KHY9_9FLAO|nr:carboxypeptidase-like regulatory domain-containing protein [Flavobacterium azooxidireducens]UPQ79980.1 carboxypeptidase-like regulatory domain-containing protein [Flavobacterium azooxidireducens]
MSKSKIVLIGFLFWVPLLFSQTIIKGKVVVKEQSAEGIHVLNLVSEKAVITNANGEFSIDVSEDDLLVFSAVHLDYWRKSISAKDIKNGFIEVQITPKDIKLEEVVVTEYTKINAQNLGIINYKPKTYTPAERRLKTATDLDPTLGAGTMVGGSISLDPLLNWISGRTKMLKSELEVERKEFLRIKLDNWNQNLFYINELNIPEEYVDGFKYFVVYDEELTGYLNSNSKVLGNFRITQLADEFLTYLKADE